MHIGGQGAAEAEIVGAGLFLANAPAMAFGIEAGRQKALQLRPAGAGGDLDQALFAVEIEHAAESPAIEQPAIAVELLSAHGVLGACDRDVLAGAAGLLQHFGHRLGGFRHKYPRVAGDIHRTVYVVAESIAFAGLLIHCGSPRLVGQDNRAASCRTSETGEVADCDTRGSGLSDRRVNNLQISRF